MTRPQKISRGLLRRSLCVLGLGGCAKPGTCPRCLDVPGHAPALDELPGAELKPYVLESLTPPGRTVLALAREHARTLGHHSVGTEHLLLALTGDPDGAALRILRQMKVNPATLYTNVLAVIVPGNPKSGTRSGLTPRARVTIELAHSAAKRIGVDHTGPEHILIGLCAEGEGIAAKVLHNAGVTAKAAENTVAADLDGRASEEETPTNTAGPAVDLSPPGSEPHAPAADPP